MAADALFPPTTAERLRSLEAFIREEKQHRIRMIERYGADSKKHAYWQKRVAQADEALAHLAALTEAVAP